MRIFLLLIALLWGPSALAVEGCTFRPGSQNVQATVALPSTLSIPRNAPNGTPLWDSGWRGFSGTTIDCSAGRVRGSHAGGIGAAVPGHTNNNGFASVFATNVPGIGVSVFWCNDYSCNPDPTQITPLPSLDWPVAESTRYALRTNWRVRLIKTDDIDVSAGEVIIGGSSAVSYNNLVVTKLSISHKSQITGLGCEMNADSRSIDVRLPTIAKTDFDASPIPRANDKAKTFNINLLCDSGVKVSYQIDGAQTSDGSNVLANSSGEGMASGVGVALFEGDLSSITQLQLGSKLVHGMTSPGTTLVKIPLTARYARTAATPSAMGSGLVSTTAVFTLFYE